MTPYNFGQTARQCCGVQRTGEAKGPELCQRFLRIEQKRQQQNIAQVADQNEDIFEWGAQAFVAQWQNFTGDENVGERGERKNDEVFLQRRAA